MNTFELVKKIIKNRQYQILEEDSADGYMAFRYQMNTMHFWANNDDHHFFFVTLPNFVDITSENIEQVIENCHQVNKAVKSVKLYVLNSVILAVAEMFYLAEEDFVFQLENALKLLVEANVKYKRLNE